MVDIAPYNAALHRQGIDWLLAKCGWEQRYITGQLGGLDALSSRMVSGTRSKVYVAEAEGRLCGFISVEFREWNGLGQVHGIAVDPDLRRERVASALVRCAERFVHELGGRGVYVDTPVTNEAARRFYSALGYRQAYTMPEYYGEGLDGVTYLKFFSEGESD